MKMKKVLTVVLAATMVMASALTASAATKQSSGSKKQESKPPKTYDSEHTQSENAKVTVGGVEKETSIGGVYAANSVDGTVIQTPKEEIKEALKLSGSQTPVILIYDTDVKKSTNAMVCVNAAVESIGGDLVSTMNIDLGAKEDGKWVTLQDGSVAMSAGLPKDADTTKTYSIVCVQPGGVITILEDQDQDPNTVTFPIQAGLGTYAIVAK